MASMRIQLDGLERHGELVEGVDRYSCAVRSELLAMSAASIDRYLKGAKATDQIRGVSTTKPSPLLRSAIKIRKAGDEVEAEPGFFEGDTVAHCGPTLKGEVARTLNLTDVHTGWVFTRSVRNNAHVHILGALKAGVEKVPFAVTGLDFDNGSEFLNHAVIKWAGLNIPHTDSTKQRCFRLQKPLQDHPPTKTFRHLRPCRSLSLAVPAISVRTWSGCLTRSGSSEPGPLDFEAPSSHLNQRMAGFSAL